MPLSIPNTTLADAYTSATTFASSDVFAWGFFTVANNPAFVQLFEGPAGQAVLQPEVYCPPATYPIAGGERPVSGIRARNAVAGSPAQFFGSVFYPREPGIQAGTPFTGNVSAGGVISQTGMLTGKIPALGNTPTAGTGFTYAHVNGSGTYVFTFNNPFSTPPVIVAAIESGSARFIAAQTVTVNGFRILIYSTAVVLTDDAFGFAAIPVT